MRDEFGRPAERALVTLLRRQTDRSLQIVVAGGSPLASTDDRGRFRFYGLPPGEYTFGVSNRSMLGPDMTQTTDASMRWAAEALRNPASPVASPPAAPVMGSAPVYYPGVTDPAAAGMIALAAGEERTGLDLTTTLVPTARIEGRLLGPDGQPARSVQMNIVPEGVTVPTMSEPMLVRPLPDGSFSVSGVIPGRYVLVARAASGATDPAGGPTSMGGRGGAPPLIDLWAMHDFEVSGHDLSGLMVMLAPGLTVRGRVVFEAQTPPPPEELPRATVRLAPASTTGVSIGTMPVVAAADGTFAVAGVAPNTYRVVTTVPGRAGAAPAWVMKSAVAGGVDVSDTPLVVRSEAGVSDVVITLTDRVTEVSGVLTDAAGRPAPEFSILVFPVDRSQWGQGSRRRLPAVRPATDGRYRVPALPPGEYYIVALTEIEQSEMYDPPFLESLIPAAQKFTLAEGEKKMLDFKLAGRAPV